MSNDSEATADEAPASDEDEEVESEAAAQPDDESESTGLQEGAFVRIDYTARTVEDGQLVDTTDPDVAEEEGVDDSQREFSPRTIVLGEGHIFDSVEETLIGSEVGDTGTATVPALEAFGEYDDEQVRTVSKDKIPEDDQFPGARVQIDDQEGFVETIIGGRARVDFNHPLAGDNIEYEWEILDTIEDREEKANGLVEMFLDVELDIWFQTDTVEEQRPIEDDDEDDSDEEEAEDESAESEEEDGSEAGDADGDDEDDGSADEDAEADDEDDGPEFETVEVEKESLYIKAEPYLTMNQQWMMQKQQICQDLIDLIGVDRVVIQEIIDDAGMAGMMGGALGGMGGDLEAALEEADIDADDLADELGD